LLSGTLALALALAPAAGAASGPPVDVTLPTVHDIRASVDVSPARDVLALLEGGPDAPAALRRLRASRAFSVAFSRDGGNPEDLLGRLVSVAAGTPDPLLSGYARRAATFGKVLDALETEGTPGGLVQARRIAALLPASRPVTARLVLVPLLGLGGFDDVVAEEDGETIWLFADLPRLAPEGLAEVVPREAVLSLLRAAAAEGWKRLFAPFRQPPGWPGETGPDFDTLLARTVNDGPETLFLIPDEFYPLGTMLEEPIERSFARWNAASETLLDPKASAEARREAFVSVTTRGDFWRRHAPVVGAKVSETILRRAGTKRFVEALAEGPRAVAALYVEVTRKTKEPQLGKAARKALEAPAAPR